MKTLLLLFITALAAVVPAHSQERTAAGSLDTQMTWTALSNAAKAAADKADAVNARVDQVVVCGKTGKIYSPGSGADGCVNAAIDTSFLNNFYTCANAGQLYNGSACVPVTSNDKRWRAGMTVTDDFSKPSRNAMNAIRNAGSPCGGHSVAIGSKCGSVDKQCYINGQVKYGYSSNDRDDMTDTVTSFICD